MSYDPNEKRDAHGMWSSSGDPLEKLAKESLKKKLTDSEKQALLSYSESSSGINSLLRKGHKLEGDYGKIVRSIDSAISK